MKPWLERSFGHSHSDHYTVAQIRAAVTALKLDADFIGLGYASFLSREEFDALPATMKGPLAFDDARALFARFVPPRFFSVPDEAPENAYASGGVSGGYTPVSSGGNASGD